MARPKLITVHGIYYRIDGTPETGTVEFRSDVQVLSSDDDSIVVPSYKTATLVNGAFSVQLPATNDPDWNPSGWTYEVVLRFTDTFKVFRIALPHDAPGSSIEMSKLLPAQSPTLGSLYAPFSHNHPEYIDRTELENADLPFAPATHTHSAADIVSGTIAAARLPIGLTSTTVAAGDHTHSNYVTQDALGAELLDYALVGHTHTLATVATTGSYNDLTDKPTIGSSAVTSVASRTGDVVLSKSDVGLSNVDNTSDLNKPVSTATQTALSGKANASHSHAQSDVIGLTDALAAKVDPEDLATVATTGNYNDLSNKPTITAPPVTSVASKTGDVTLVKADVGLANVDNTSDANKPVSTATQTALNGKANTSHTHVIADTTGLQTALDGKASATHNHAIADVTGLQTALDDKATDAELAAGLATKADVGHVHEGTAVTNPITLTMLASPPTIPAAGTSILYTRDLNGGALLAYKSSSGVEYSILRDVVFQVRNTTGSTIPKGTPVYVSNFSSGGDNSIEVAPALANSTTTMPVLGITTADIANNAYGGCMRFGRMENVNTSAFTFRDLLYVSSTVAGGMTNSQPPTTATSQRIATVARVHATQGVLYVDIQTMLHNSAGSNRESWTIGSGTAASLSYRMVSTGNTVSSLTATPTAARTWTLPDASGTLARAEDINTKVTGPGSATDNALARFDATTGKLIQDSLVTVSDTGTLILTPQASVAYAAGQLFYNSTTESLEFHNNNSNVAMQVGQELWIRVWNATGTAISNGVPVYLNGVNAGSGLPTVALAAANSVTTAQVAGLTTEAIANGASGFVTLSGSVSGINTSAFTAGATLFLSATAGTLTATAPASPNYRVSLGTVLISNATTGRIMVRPGSPDQGFGTANQVLGMNNAGTAFEHKTVNATNNQITVTHAANAITLGLANNTALPGAPTAATATAGTNTTQIATTAFVQTAASTKAPNIMVWNGSAYVASTTATVYVGPNDPGTMPEGSIWIDTDA
jgi:hypothetical protein